jgi:hypothetical protein
LTVVTPDPTTLDGPPPDPAVNLLDTESTFVPAGSDFANSPLAWRSRQGPSFALWTKAMSTSRSLCDGKLVAEEEMLASPRSKSEDFASATLSGSVLRTPTHFAKAAW